jgi:hypothetical protein
VTRPGSFIVAPGDLEASRGAMDPESPHDALDQEERHHRLDREKGQHGLDPETRRAIERWFVRRGVPQLVEGYATEQSMDARATPAILAWILLGSVWVVGTPRGLPDAANAGIAAGTVLLVAAGLLVANRLRGRPALARPAKYDLGDIAVFAGLPGIAAVLVHGSAEAGLAAALTTATGIGLIYIVVGFGLASIGAWAVGWLLAQLVQIVGLVARTLPLLLILVAFLLFASELWQAARTIGVLDRLGAALLLSASAVAFLASRARRELQPLENATSWSGILSDVEGTPAAPLADALHGRELHVPPLTTLQRLNVTLLVLITQFLQSVFVGFVVFLFLVAFGLLALPVSVQEAWIGAPPQPLVSFEALSEVRTLSLELLTVTALLGGFAALYFSGFSLTDQTYREEALAEVLGDVRRILAARALYAASLAGSTGV